MSTTDSLIRRVEAMHRRAAQYGEGDPNLSFELADAFRALDLEAVKVSQSFITDLLASLRELVERWRATGAEKDRYHAVMGIGWTVCANELATLLDAPVESLHPDNASD